MLVVAFLQWWYGPGWRDAATQLATRLRTTSMGFSVPILLQTMFQPWHRITSDPGRSLQDKLRAMVDNAVSRLVGFMVRLLALGTAMLLLTVTALVGGLIVALWPILPILGPLLIVLGLL